MTAFSTSGKRWVRSQGRASLLRQPNGGIGNEGKSRQWSRDSSGSFRGGDKKYRRSTREEPLEGKPLFFRGAEQKGSYASVQKHPQVTGRRQIQDISVTLRCSVVQLLTLHFSPESSCAPLFCNEREEDLTHPGRRLLPGVEYECTHHCRATHTSTNVVSCGLAHLLKQRCCRWGQCMRANRNRFFFRDGLSCCRTMSY